MWLHDDAKTDEGESQWGLKWNIIGIKMCQRDWLTRQAPESRSAATLGSLLFAVRLHSLSRSLIQGSFNRTAALTSTRCLKDRPNPTQPNPANLGHCQPDTATISFFVQNQQNLLKFPLCTPRPYNLISCSALSFHRSVLSSLFVGDEFWNLLSFHPPML